MPDQNGNKYRESLGRWCLRMSGIVIVAIIIIQLVSSILSTNTIRNSVTSFNQYFKPIDANVNISVVLAPSLTTVHNDSTTHHITRGPDETKVVDDAVKMESNTSLVVGSKKLCSLMPANLIQKVPIDRVAKDWLTIQEKYNNLQPGGTHRPKECTSRYRMAIIVPYRKREDQLKIFSMHMHQFLQHQQIDYGIFIIEEELPTKFNRAMLMNIGFAEAVKDTAYTDFDGKQVNRPYECFAFHDVDLLPEDERNLYSCPQTPRHMSSAVDKFDYKLPYSAIFGGVSMFNKKDFLTINGFSNSYWGWGGEDDDLMRRVKFRKLPVSRYPLNIARYTMIKHTTEALNKPNPRRMSLLNTAESRIDTDGLSNLKYEVTLKSRRALFTLVKVKISET